MLQYNESFAKINDDEFETDKTKTNAELIDEVYYEYHGKQYDGYSAVDELERLTLKGVVVA